MAASQHIEAGEWSEAQECLNAVIRFEPENGTAYQQRVWVLLELGRLVEALQDAELAVRMEPDDSESYRAQGAACLKAGQFEQAVVDLTRYVAEEDTSVASGTRASRGYYLRIGLRRTWQRSKSDQGLRPSNPLLARLAGTLRGSRRSLRGRRQFGAHRADHNEARRRAAP